MTKDEQITALEDRISELEALLGVDPASTECYHAIGLQPIARKVLGYIVKRDVATREGLYAAIYGARPECDQPVDVKAAIGVRIYTIRNVLDRYGIELTTIQGVGWKMTTAAKRRLAEVIAEHDERPVKMNLSMKKENPEPRRGY